MLSQGPTSLQQNAQLQFRLQSPSRLKRLSLRPLKTKPCEQICSQTLTSWDSIRKYIKENVKSQRENVMRVYVNTMSDHLQGDQEEERLYQMWSHRNKIKEFEANNKSECIEPIKKDKEKPKQDLSMTISNQFHHKGPSVKKPLTRIKWKSQEKKPTAVTPRRPALIKIHSPRPLSKTKPPLPELPDLRIKSKRLKINKSKRQTTSHELNPWEFLVMALDHQPCHFDM